MNEAEKNIYDLLCRYSEMRTLFLVDSRCGLYENALKSLNTCMSILSDNERFIITRHLIDGIAWSRIVYEYNHLSSRSKGKSLSTLRRMQHGAIEKMVEYSSHHS